MFYFLAKSLSEHLLFNALTYTTTRAILGFLTAFVMSLAFGRPLFKWLYLKGYKDYPRVYGEDKPGSKKYTPTMGGLLIALTSIGSMLLWTNFVDIRVMVVLASILVFGGIGYIDDTQKMRAKNADKGMSRIGKLIPQASFGLLLGVMAWYNLGETFPTIDGDSFGKSIIVPFFKAPFIVVPGIVMVILATGWSIVVSNAVNYTDGLDGMLAIPSFLVFLVLGLFSFVMGNVSIAEYLYFPFLLGANELAIICAIFMGACLGFAWFNCFPAEVFMGDFGSLMLGGVMMTISFLIHQEVIFLIVGGVIMFQFLTSAVQDYYFFKFVGKRYFRSAPYHEGLVKSYKMAESKVVVRYWIVSILLAAFSIITMKLR